MWLLKVEVCSSYLERILASNYIRKETSYIPLSFVRVGVPNMDVESLPLEKAPLLLRRIKRRARAGRFSRNRGGCGRPRPKPEYLSLLAIGLSSSCSESVSSSCLRDKSGKTAGKLFRGPFAVLLSS